MKNTVKIIAAIMVIGLTSCKMQFDANDLRPTTSVPTDLGEKSDQNVELDESEMTFENKG